MTDMTAYERLEAKLDGGIRRGMARCPAHDDGTASLSVKNGDGKALVHCQAGCDRKAVLDVIGWTDADLFDKPREHATAGDDWTPAGPAVATYTYTDATGNTLFGVCRTASKDFRQWRPDPSRPHGRAWTIKGVKLVPYRLPKVLAAVEAGETVFIAEGEKDVHALERAGVTATCNPGGAMKWRAEYGKHLADAEVVVVADNDEPGIKHAQDVAAKLDGTAAAVRIVRAATGKDASDHLTAGHAPGDFIPLDTENASPAPADGGELPETNEDERSSSGSWPSPSNPMAVAREIAAGYQHDSGTLKLRRWRGTWMIWDGTHWAEAEDTALRKDIYTQLEHAKYESGDGNEKPWAPNKSKIANLLDALTAITHLPEDVDTPAWTSEGQHEPASEIVACENGLLHVGSRQVIEHTPAYFSTVSVPFPYTPEAAEPERWHAFLKQLWPDDQGSIDALQELFGYILSGRTDLQKILLLIGPARSGKGTIARVLAALMGRGNVTGPTLGALAAQFGLWPLIGKPLAIIPDARINGASQGVVVEKLLSISGEDMLTVDRKHLEAWTGKLSTRLVILSNELPRFGDASGAISSRFVILMTTESFLGRENSRLTSQLLAELPGILNWSLDGLTRLAANGALTEPATSADARTALQDMVSPISAFVREQTDRSGSVPCSELFAAWKAWCEENNHRAGSVQTFGKDLRAVVPLLRVTQPRDERGQQSERHYSGISLKKDRPAVADAACQRVSDPSEPELTRADTRRNALQVHHYCQTIGCESEDTRLYPAGWLCPAHAPGQRRPVSIEPTEPEDPS